MERWDIERMESEGRSGMRLVLVQKSQSPYFQTQVHPHLLILVLLVPNVFLVLCYVSGLDLELSPLLA